MALISGPTIADAIADPNNELAKLVAREKDDAKLVDELFLRILNRPGDAEAEIEASRQPTSGDRRRSPAARRALGRSARPRSSPIRPKLEREREAAIAAAKDELAAYEKETGPEARRAGEAEGRDDGRARSRPEGLRGRRSRPSWPTGRRADADRSRVGCPIPTALEADGRADADPGARPLDRRLRARTSKATYTVVAETDLTGITGDPPRSPGRRPTPRRAGPGRAPDGNFVLTEFEVTAAPKADPKQAQAGRARRTPWPTSARTNFDDQAAIDGNPNNASKGWADLAGLRRDPLGDLRDQGADRRSRAARS